MTQRIGIFGGTFDPIHMGHLVLADKAREQLHLDRVLFLPAAIPPHKRDIQITDGKLRKEMIEIAIAAEDAFDVSDVELNRTGVSYTVDTLRELKKQFPEDEFVLLVGADTIHDIPEWKEPEEVVRLASFGVAERPGAKSIAEATMAGARIERIEMPALEISSTGIRELVRSGRSIRYLVPPAVEAFIAANGLYRNESPMPAEARHGH